MNTTDEKKNSSDQLEVPKNKGTPVDLKEKYKEMYGDHPNDGSLDEINGFYHLNREYMFKMQTRLSKWHEIFFKFWEIGKPVFTRSIETAAVRFNKEGRYINFMFNPEFWLSLDDYTRDFIVCHEMLHIIFNHASRAKDQRINHSLLNVAMDIVVNHTLVDEFNFSRDKLKGFLSSNDPNKAGCWIDTTFKNLIDKGEIVPEGRNFEYYFNLIKRDAKQIILISAGGGNKMVDDHEGWDEDEMGEVIKEVDKNLSDGEKNKIKDMLKKHTMPKENNPDGDEDPGKDKTQPTGEGKDMEAGDTAGGLWHFADMTKKIKKKKKWETIIKKWLLSKIKYSFKDVEQWVRQPRRLAFLPQRDLFIPSEMEVEERIPEKKKITLWFFLDTSGSCAHLADRFFNAARSIPDGKNDPFEVELYCFDTKVYKVENGELKGFGGTSFQVIESYIQKKIKERNIKYPDSVWIITDGYGDTVEPELPEKWHWFLTEGYSDSYIPKQSNKYLLADYE